jgi:hypothetical protein
MKTFIANAKWKKWPHVGECYRVRSRGGASAFTREGFVWTDAAGYPVDRPASAIRFHGGPNNGFIDEIVKRTTQVKTISKEKS